MARERRLSQVGKLHQIDLAIRFCDPRSGESTAVPTPDLPSGRVVQPTRLRPAPRQQRLGDLSTEATIAS